MPRRSETLATSTYVDSERVEWVEMLSFEAERKSPTLEDRI
jgi:hypothetical protein